MPQKAIESRSVFLNFPFDRSYETVFLGIIAGLISLKIRPRCVIEIPDTGQGRMSRIYELITSCQSSLHDLSSVGLPVRFNMPFELGIAYALKQQDDRYQFVIFEKKRYRLEKHLSDLKMIDPKIHAGDGKKALDCIYECFVPEREIVPLKMGLKIYASLLSSRAEIRGNHETIFNRSSFYQIISDASLIANAS